MFYASKFDRDWLQKQVAIAEYLDTYSELSARLESIQAFTKLCQKAGVKNSFALLSTTKDDVWYTLSSL